MYLKDKSTVCSRYHSLKSRGYKLMTKVQLFPITTRLTRGQNKVAYYLDMGLGKTFVATEKAEELGTNIIIIVCQKSKLEDWAEHYQKYYPRYQVIIYKKPLTNIPPDTVLDY